MSTQQDIYAAGSENRPPMLNKENYVPWSSRLLRYAKSRPNGKLIHNSIINGPYVRRMIPEPGDPNHDVPMNETFYVQTDDELTEKELKQIEVDDQAIQTILLGLPKDIYAAVDICETSQEIWLRVQQMMKGSDIGFQEKKANEINTFQKRLPEVYDLKVERLERTQDPLALKATSNNPYTFLVLHQDQPLFNQNYMQQPMPNSEDITDPTTAMNMALALMAKALKLNYSTPTNNNQRISSNPRNRQIAQLGMNMGQDRQMQMVGGNSGNQFRQYAGQNEGNLNGNANPNGNGNLVSARVEDNATGHNGNQIRCYNYRGVGRFARKCTVRPRRRDVAYLQTQLLIAQKKEVGIQLQAEEFDLMAAAADLFEIEEVNANYILMANLQQASTSGTQTDKAPVYDSYGSAEVHNYENCYDNEIFNMFTQEEHYTELLKPIPEPHQVLQNDNNVISEVFRVEQSGGTVEQYPTNVEETRVLYDSLYNNLAIEVEKLNTVNRKLRETNAELTTQLARYKNQEKCFEISQEKYDKLERCYQKSVYQEQCLSKKINALHLSSGKQIMTLNEEISYLNKQLSVEKSTVSSLLEEKKKLKSDFKIREDELLDKQIQLEKRIKELDNILVKTGQSIQTIHMLSPKPDSFYHTEKKMALGYQNPFYLKVQNFEIQFLKEAAKFVGDFKSLAKEADESLAKHKALELEIDRLLRAVVSQDIMSVVQNNSVGETSYLQTELERTKERFENCIIKKENEYAKLWNDWINPFKPSSEEKHLPNKVRASVRTNPITISQPPVIAKKVVNSDSNGLSSTGVDNTRLEGHSLGAIQKLIGNKKHMSSECNNVKLATQNVKSKVVCAMCKQCLNSVNHDVCLPNYVNGMNSRGNRTTNLYTINLQEMAFASPICLMARASSTKSWLWHQRLSHLNFDTINDLAKNDLVFGLLKFKYHKDHICPFCEQGKSKRASHPPKPVPNSRQRLHLLHMDLCGPMRIASINGKRYVLVIVDDFSRYTWVHFLRSKDEAPERLLLRVSLKTAPSFTIILIKHHASSLPEEKRISPFYMYPGLFVIPRMIMKILRSLAQKVILAFLLVILLIPVLTDSKLKLQSMTSGQISSGLDLTYAPLTITTQQATECELELLFEAMYDDYIGGQPSIARRTVPTAQAHQVRQTPTTSTSIADTAPTPTNSCSQATNSPNISQDVDGLNSQQQHALQQGNQAPLQPETVVDNVSNAMFDANTFVNPFATPTTSVVESSSSQYNVKEAMTDPAWIESMQEELLQFKRLDVWVLVPASDNITPLTLKWLFKNKHDKENTVIRNKSRLVVRGYCQEEGIDFKESFAPGSTDPTLFIRRFVDDILVGVKRIIRYLRGTVNTGLWYTKDSGFELTGFSNPDYAGCKDTFKSTSGGA
nr:retrovirus-related Pol polyprotein from transposon TNT 1-94 [Tanacetum cinerariifolium]